MKLIFFFLIAISAFSFKIIAQNNITAADSVLAIAEKMPEFKGGQSALYTYLVNNLAWPDVSADKIYEAKITLGFIVTKQGKISKARVVKGAHAKLDAEALRVIAAMPDWENGLNKGKPVNVFVNIPLTYRNNNRPVEEAPVNVVKPKPKTTTVKKKKK
jgi:TonB family protein